MGGDGTFNIIMNNLFLRRQSEGHIDVNDLHATLVPIDIPVAFIPGGIVQLVETSGVGPFSEIGYYFSG